MSTSSIFSPEQECTIFLSFDTVNYRLEFSDQSRIGRSNQVPDGNQLLKHNLGTVHDQAVAGSVERDVEQSKEYFDMDQH